MTRHLDAYARAREIAEERLVRERTLLESVSPDERAAIEEVAYAISSKVADCILDEARSPDSQVPV